MTSLSKAMPFANLQYVFTFVSAISKAPEARPILAALSFGLIYLVLIPALIFVGLVVIGAIGYAAQKILELPFGIWGLSLGFWMVKIGVDHAGR